MRLYFIAYCERGSTASFRPDLLRRALERARRLLAGIAAGTGDEDGGEAYLAFLRRMCNPNGYVDPYRLTTSLLTRDRGVPVGRLARSVFG
jgi:hypothetical protein